MYESYLEDSAKAGLIVERGSGGMLGMSLECRSAASSDKDKEKVMNDLAWKRLL